MKKTLLLSLVLVLAFAAYALAFGPMDAVKAAKNAASAKDNALKLSTLDAGLAKYEGTALDPVKEKPYSYKTFGDAQWDKLAESSAKTALALTFSEKVLAAPEPKKEDLEAAQKVFGPLATGAGTLVTSLTSFVTGVASDPAKAVMLKEAKSVADNMKVIAEKAPKVAGQLKDKLAALAANPPAVPGK